MKSIIIVLFFFNIAISQQNQNVIFKNAIASIKQSEEFKSYSKDGTVKNDNIKVSKNVYSICEFSIFFENIIGKEVFKNCDSNWINDSFEKIHDTNNLSDKGKKSYNLWFSNIVDSYFVVEIKKLNHSNVSLANLFKIENGKANLIESIQITYN